MLNWSLLSVFVPTFFLVSLTPGMCMTLAMTLGMTQGVRRTLWMMVGELLGVGLVAVSAVIGVATIMLRYPLVFSAFKLAGGAYLVWLGIQMWRSRGRLALGGVGEASAAPRASRRTLAAQGFVTAIANPKGWAFFIALLPPFLDASLRADFALQNAGGVRVPMSAGDITYTTAFTLLPFTNVLVELDITGQEVVDALEDAVSNHLDAAQSTGSQPYAAGLRWDLDLPQPKGTRFSNVEVKNGSGSWVAIEPATTYVMVTNDFIAEGRDGYTTLGEVTDDGRTTNTFLLYTQSLVDYLLKTGMVSPPLRADYSHQQVINASGSTLMD